MRWTPSVGHSSGHGGRRPASVGDLVRSPLLETFGPDLRVGTTDISHRNGDDRRIGKGTSMGISIRGIAAGGGTRVQAGPGGAAGEAGRERGERRRKLGRLGLIAVRQLSTGKKERSISTNQTTAQHSAANTAIFSTLCRTQSCDRGFLLRGRIAIHFQRATPARSAARRSRHRHSSKIATPARRVRNKARGEWLGCGSVESGSRGPHGNRRSGSFAFHIGLNRGFSILLIVVLLGFDVLETAFDPLDGILASRPLARVLRSWSRYSGEGRAVAIVGTAAGQALRAFSVRVAILGF
jgi:hypothetical protein